MGDTGKTHSALKLSCMQFAAGGSAGLVEVSLMHPLDLIKTRFQIQSATAGDPHYYTSVGDCMKKMYRAEGFFSFWKGILPPILSDTPKRAIKFLTFEQYKGIGLHLGALPGIAFTAAGLCSGLTEAIFINPFEVVKVKLQAQRGSYKDRQSTYSAAREILRADGFGLRGLNKGLSATLFRNGIFNMIYFGYYFNMKLIVPEPSDGRLELLRRFVLGLSAGTLASCANIPFDVAKSRIQGPQPVPGQIKYKSTIPSVMMVYREEGARALYKGLVPKVLRLGPGGAILLIVYEYFYEWMRYNL